MSRRPPVALVLALRRPLLLVVAAALVASLSHTCALRNGGTVACWGDNEWGQLGDGRPPSVAPRSPWTG